MSLKTLGKNIKYYRKLRGLTTEQVANFLEISESTYHDFERTGKKLTLVHLINLEDLLNVDMYDMFKKDRYKHSESFKTINLKDMSIGDLTSISQFHRIVKNYITMKEIAKENEHVRI